MSSARKRAYFNCKDGRTALSPKFCTTPLPKIQLNVLPQVSVFVILTRFIVDIEFCYHLASFTIPLPLTPACQSFICLISGSHRRWEVWNSFSYPPNTVKRSWGRSWTKLDTFWRTLLSPLNNSRAFVHVMTRMSSLFWFFPFNPGRSDFAFFSLDSVSNLPASLNLQHIWTTCAIKSSWIGAGVFMGLRLLSRYVFDWFRECNPSVPLTTHITSYSWEISRSSKIIGQ